MMQFNLFKFKLTRLKIYDHHEIHYESLKRDPFQLEHPALSNKNFFPLKGRFFGNRHSSFMIN